MPTKFTYKSSSTPTFEGQRVERFLRIAARRSASFHGSDADCESNDEEDHHPMEMIPEEQQPEREETGM